MRIGVQISSLKPLLTTPEKVLAAFRRVADIGARVVQLQWVDPAVPPEAVAAALREAGLVSVSVQDFYDSVAADREYYIRMNELTGGEWLCVSRVPDRFKSAEGLARYAGELNDLNEALKSRGQRLCFHPVAADYKEVEGVSPVEWLMNQLGDMKLCLDLYHLARAGVDMPRFIDKWAASVVMVHFKDAKNGALVPAGQGDTPWDGVVGACLRAGVPWAFVEQESWDRDPCDCLKEAMDWVNGQISAFQAQPRA